jgi:transposase
MPSRKFQVRCQVPPQLELQVVETYQRTPMALQQLADQFGLHRRVVNGILKRYHIPLYERSILLRFNPRPKKLTEEQRQELLDRLKHGDTLVSISRTFGITKERVRQIGLAAGLPPRRQTRAAARRKVLRERAEASKQRRNERYREHMQQVEHLAALWRRGMSLVEIAQELKTTEGAVRSRIWRLRTSMPTLFPYRVCLIARP